MIWLLGLLIVLGYRVFNAGMNSKALFYKDVRSSYNSTQTRREFDGELVIGYIAVTAGLSLFWPISLPGYGLYALGKRYAK